MRGVPSSASLLAKQRLKGAGVAATVSKAPAMADDLIYVEWRSIDEEDGDDRKIEEGPAPWVRRGTALPVVGDDALLLLDVIGDPYVLVF